MSIPIQVSPPVGDPSAPVQANRSERALHHQVLIVEDVLPERVRLAAMLHRLGYQVHEASQGQQALEVLDAEPIGLVISDWRMPVMDGMSLLDAIQRRFEKAPYFMLLTGQDAVCDLVAAMDAGADDFIRKPFNAEELRTRLHAGSRIIRLRSQLEDKNQRLQSALAREHHLNQSLQGDLDAAAQLQRTVLPAADLAIPGLSFGHYFQPATGVAGDTYNILPLGNNQIAFYHIDVAGHGIRAALLSFALSRFLGDPASRAIDLTQQSDDGKLQVHSPAQVVSELNRRFLDDDHCRNYFTMIYGVVDLVSGRGRLCQAGHPHPILADRNGTVSPVGSGGLPVGIMPDAQYEDTHFELGEGAKMLVYSDGLTGCTLPSGRVIDQAALRRLLGRYAERTPDMLTRSLARLIDRLLTVHASEDDISFMCLQRMPELKQTLLQNSHRGPADEPASPNHPSH